jgi:hypothetical protein
VTWIQHHTTSERLAADAEVAARRSDVALAQDLYRQAGEAEEQALADLEPAKSRTLGISAVSAVSLYYKAAQFQTSERVAYRWLASEYLPSFAAEQLRGLLQSVWSEQIRLRANVRFAPGQVIVSVKGGQVVEGGAPLDLIVEKVQTVQALFYRTAEFLRDVPHRKRGAPTNDIRETCRPWLFQTSPGSYQFAVAVQEASQPGLFDADEPRPKEVADKFLSILRASAEAPQEELPLLVPNPDYRSTFLKLTRSLAPTGKSFSQLEVRSATQTHAVTLRPSTRAVVSEAIRAARPSLANGDEHLTIKGLLRAVHLDQDWIEVTEDADHVRIDQVGEVVDDVIGPMVNRSVLVHVTRDDRGKFHFRDIETNE